MPERLTDRTTSLAQRQTFITAIPFFSILTEDESKELATLFFEVRYTAQENIVIEDTLVESVYIIINGHAEVSCQDPLNPDIKIPLASLGPGELIGLTDTGFFSTTGKRTATVTALTEMILLGLDLNQLNQFFKKHAHLQLQDPKVTEKMLRMHLIKQSLPFNQLSYERLVWLASKIEEVSFPAGTILFQQGEIGNSCYLICTGQVEIIAKDEQNGEHTLAILKSPSLFGEATLITNTPRNATARVLEKCDLLVLRHEHLSELIETESEVAQTLMALMVDRSRPKRHPDIVLYPRTTDDGQEIAILKDTQKKTYFKLSTAGWFVWQQLNGKHTLRDITLLLAEHFHIFAPDMVTALISKLEKEGFIYNIKNVKNDKSDKAPFWWKIVLKMRNIFEVNITFKNADHWLTKLYHTGIYFFFTPFGITLLTLLAISGAFAFGISISHIIYLLRTIENGWLLLILVFPLTTFSLLLHELGHAFATKAAGHEVHYIGVGWNWIKPVAFTDISDMWLSNRKARILVNLAGIFTDIVTAGVATLLIFITHNPYYQCSLWLFALYTYINAFYMLCPWQDLDGYFILMDVFGCQQLRYSAVKWLVEEYPHLFRQPIMFRIKEIIYWIMCFIYLVLVVLLTLLIQGFVFNILGIHITNSWLVVIAPLLMFSLSCVTIIVNMRIQVEE